MFAVVLGNSVSASEPTSLLDAVDGRFDIGVGIGLKAIRSRENAELAVRHFSQAGDGIATGAFHLEKLNGRDCLVAPDGKPFLSLGINHIQALTQKGEPDLFATKFNRDRTKASEAALADLRAMGFNTAGYGAFVQMRAMIPYMADSFLAKNSNFLPDSEFFHPDIFDPRVQEEIRKKLRNMCRVTDNPNLIGYYWTDTPQWDLKRAQRKRGTDWVSTIRELPADAPGKRRYEQFLADCEATGVPAEDDGFLRLIAREYYKVIGEETRRLHRNALIFGERYLVNDHPDCVLEEAMPYIDVLSIQPGGAKFDGAYLDRLHAKYKKPILLCDHQISFPTARYPKTMWQQLKSEEAAGLAYAQYLKEAFAKPYIIGYHRCQYIDRFATYQGVLKQGVLREDGTPYKKLVEITREANLEAIRKFDAACD